MKNFILSFIGVLVCTTAFAKGFSKEEAERFLRQKRPNFIVYADKKFTQHVKALFSKSESPAVAEGDFDGNGTRDWAFFGQENKDDVVLVVLKLKKNPQIIEVTREKTLAEKDSFTVMDGETQKGMSRYIATAGEEEKQDMTTSFKQDLLLFEMFGGFSDAYIVKGTSSQKIDSDSD